MVPPTAASLGPVAHGLPEGGRERERERRVCRRKEGERVKGK